ncbi:MAG: NfeD family protein, partial [Promethearchaeota archaeon]
IDSRDLSDATPAPFMLLFSTFLLVFGISGIILYFLITNWLRFLIFFITPLIAYLFTHYISVGWKKIAKSRYYNISSTQNLIGVQGEVVLSVDYRGGVIKIPSSTPLKFEKVHVKPLKLDSQFEEGEMVYICDVNKGFLLVDNNKKLIKRRG